MTGPSGLAPDGGSAVKMKGTLKPNTPARTKGGKGKGTLRMDRKPAESIKDRVIQELDRFLRPGKK